MNRKQYDSLSKYEKTFKSALKSNFARLSVGEFNDIANIYAEMYKENLTQSQKSCSTCRLKALKKIGNDYFKYKEKLEEKSVKDSNLTEQNNVE